MDVATNPAYEHCVDRDKVVARLAHGIDIKLAILKGLEEKG